MNQITTMAVDLSKRDFQAVTEDRQGQEVSDPRFRSREAFAAFIQTLQPPLVVGMESGPGAQAWARAMAARGLQVRLLPAQRVAEHRSGAKNDRNDARAILRALRDRSIHPVPIKSPEQLAMQAVHRARSGWVRRRTALSNQIRGLLLEQDVAIARGDAALERAMQRVLGSTLLPIPDPLRDLVACLYGEWQQQAERIARVTAPLRRWARSDPVARQFAASFGIVPDQMSTAGKTRLGRMSRRGDGYIRALAVQGAHAVLQALRPDAQDPLSRRLRRWRERHGTKGAAVRLANRNLRVVWAVLKRGNDYRRTYSPGQPSAATQPEA